MKDISKTEINTQKEFTPKWVGFYGKLQKGIDGLKISTVSKK